MKRLMYLLIGVMGSSVVLAACNIGGTDISSGQSDAQQAQILESQQQGSDSLTLDQSQPIPKFRHSELRAEVIDLEKWQAAGSPATAFWTTNDGRLLYTCPTIGPAVPSTTQLTNPVQAVVKGSGGDSAGGVTSTGNPEPVGVYTGNSSGTYNACVAPDGTTYPGYDEGYVQIIGAPATWVAVDEPDAAKANDVTGIGYHGYVKLVGSPPPIFSDVKNGTPHPATP